MIKLSPKLRFILIAGVFVAFYLISIFTQTLWLTDFSVILIGIALLHYRHQIAKIVIAGNDKLSQDVPITVVFQRKMYQIVGLWMGIGFILFGIVNILSTLGVISLPITI